MTPRQNAFAAEYVVDHNGAAAAVRAGYSRKAAKQTASELLTNPNVRALVAQHEAAAAGRLGVTKERVIQELEAAIEVARLQGNPGAMIQGWTQIAKMCGYFAPEQRKVEVSVDARDFASQVREMSESELLELSAGSGE
jgi:phage terminase small subunit